MGCQTKLILGELCKIREMVRDCGIFAYSVFARLANTTCMYNQEKNVWKCKNNKKKRNKISEIIIDLIEAWKCNYLPFFWKLWQPDRPTNRPIMDRRGQRVIEITKKKRIKKNINYKEQCQRTGPLVSPRAYLPSFNGWRKCETHKKGVQGHWRSLYILFLKKEGRRKKDTVFLAYPLL